MTNKKMLEEDRILNEMLEIAQALQGHALITKKNMAKMNLLCQKVPEYTSEKVTAIRVEKPNCSHT